MGRIAKVISSVSAVVRGAKATRIKSNPGAIANRLSDIYTSPGEDSRPLDSDFTYLADTEKQGQTVAVGFLDPKNEQKAGRGEKRIYARDENGEVVIELFLKSDGSGILINDLGSVELKTNGTISGNNDAGGSFELKGSNGAFIINGVTIDTDGNISTPGDVSADGEVTAKAAVPAASVSLSTHETATAPDGPIAPPTPGT